MTFVPILATLLLAVTATSEPIDVTAEDIYRGKHVGERVRFTGTVMDAFRDEANPNYTFIVLASGRDTLYLPSTQLTDEDLHGLVDATVTIVGTGASYRNVGPRARLGFEVNILDRKDITILKPAPSDPFNVPFLGGSVHDVWQPKPNEARRRRLCGTVAATWQKNRILLRTKEDETSLIELSGSDLPPVGISIEVVGLPETDFYHLNLSRALWRPSVETVISNPAPESVSAEFLLTDGHGRRRYNVEHHGRVVRLAGTVRNLPGQVDGNGVMYLACGDFLVPVDASSVPTALDHVKSGASVEVTGLCVMETDNWRPQAPFPHIRVMSIVLRTPEDLVILAYPPWWTISRLFIALGILLALLVAILIWNNALRHAVNRKSRELLHEQIGRERAQLKAEERTRLAVELHDSFAQNLSGAGMELETAQQLCGNDQSPMRHHLDLAVKTLKSSRDDLRNCLWDLRSRALDEKTMDAAILRTLTPYVNKTKVSVAFRVARDILPSDVVHAVLRIIREFTLNAIRHGKAGSVRIAGSVENGQLLFSVTDNGNGFDPDDCPGVLQGHFGLEGIRERVDSLGGTVILTSSLGSGTKARVTLPLATIQESDS